MSYSGNIIADMEYDTYQRRSDCPACERGILEPAEPNEDGAEMVICNSCEYTQEAA